MKTALVTVDLGFGDSGKGETVNALVRRYNSKLVVRYNGGSQCGHHVTNDDGRTHVFAQFGSGTFVPGVKTLIGKDVIFNPFTMETEEEHLRSVGVTDAFERTYVDERCLVTTPYHRALNRIREMARGEGRHSSCGMGCGETVADAIARPNGTLRVGDLRNVSFVTKTLERTRDALRDEARALTNERGDEFSTFDYPIRKMADRYLNFASKIYTVGEDYVACLLNDLGGDTIVFEGAQGIMLDENHGFHPYTTWSNTTTDNAHKMLIDAGFKGKAYDVGVMRTFSTRHGAGPFPSEVARSLSVMPLIQDDHNATNQWQGNLRAGWMDFYALNRAITANAGIDFLAVTHCDKLSNFESWPCVTSWTVEPPTQYADMTLEEKESITRSMMTSVAFGVDAIGSSDVLNEIQTRLKTPILMESHGKGFARKRFSYSDLDRLRDHVMPSAPQPILAPKNANVAAP